MSNVAILFSALILFMSGGYVYAAYSDPTKPLGYSDPGKIRKTLVLQAIFNRSGSMEAIVNGKSVKPGDSVLDAKIVSIHSKHVVYVRGGEKLKLSLRKNVFAQGGK